MKPLQQNTTPRLQTGVGLVEILVTVVVLAVGLLGVAALLSSGLRASEASMLRSKANELAHEMVERLYARPGDARCGRFNIALGAAAPAGALPYQADLQRWRAHLAADLPAGDGSINCVASTPATPCETQNPAACTVVVQWDESRAERTAVPALQTFTVVARP